MSSLLSQGYELYEIKYQMLQCLKKPGSLPIQIKTTPNGFFNKSLKETSLLESLTSLCRVNSPEEIFNLELEPETTQTNTNTPDTEVSRVTEDLEDDLDDFSESDTQFIMEIEMDMEIEPLGARTGTVTPCSELVMGSEQSDLSDVSEGSLQFELRL